MPLFDKDLVVKDLDFSSTQDTLSGILSSKKNVEARHTEESIFETLR